MSDKCLRSSYNVFYSYSHKDEIFREELEKHFSMLRREGVIKDWHDRKIGAGHEWAGVIDEQLNKADIILLLISADFLASDYCYDVEMKHAMKRHEAGDAHVIPVILRPVDWTQTMFGKLQALPKDAKPVTKWSDRDEAFENIAKGIKSICYEHHNATRQTDSVKVTKYCDRELTLSDKDKLKPKPNSPEYCYSNLFQLGPITLPYIVIIGSWQKNINEYRRGEITSITDTTAKYMLPDDFKDIPNPSPYSSEDKCRLLAYDCEIMRPYPNRLTFTFSKISYFDYVMSGERLDKSLPDNPNQSFRDKYASSIELHDFSNSQLTNICGVGVFVITRDNKIIISKHSRNVQVYGGIWSYSASGSMDWKNNVHPFTEVARECFEEIGHELNLDNTFLIGFGVDTKKLYFQFSFIERTAQTSGEILAKARMAQDFHAEMEELKALSFELESIVTSIKNMELEPAAAAALLTLCSKQFGYDAVEKAIDPFHVRSRLRDEMTAEWRHRALRPGNLAVMSARYPYERCDDESTKYVKSVFDFIGDDINDQSVVEIGPGIGRITKLLVERCKAVTCIDLSNEMLERNRAYLGSLADHVTYLQMFAQDYQPKQKHDILISSLMLIHNVDENDFANLTKVMTTCANTIFLFEHTDVGYQVSAHTRPRREAEFLSAFKDYHIERRGQYQLFHDNIVFLKLVKSTENSQIEE